MVNILYFNVVYQQQSVSFILILDFLRGIHKNISKKKIHHSMTVIDISYNYKKKKPSCENSTILMMHVYY